MDRRTFLRTASIGAAGAAFGNVRARATERDDGGARPAIEVLRLHGTPRERGRIHGETLRSKIHALCGIWKEHLGRPENVPADAYVETFLSDTRFEPAIAKWTPDVSEEIRGIAEGSGLPYRTVLAMQLVDEEWWYSMTRDLAGKESGAGEKCTVIGVSKSASGGPTLVAQNLDIPGFCDGFMTILRVSGPDSDLESLVLSYAGLVALNGVNNRGVAVCVNALLQLADSKDGLPVACVIRGLLARETLETAERFVREVTHASGQAYAIGGPDRVVCYECSGTKAVPFLPAPGGTRFVHTNHPLANDDLSPLGKLLKEGKLNPPGPANSAARYRAAECRVVDVAEKAAVGIDTIQAALGSHDSEKDPVCRHANGPDAGFTAATTIFELASPPRMLAAPNPPCAGRFAEYRFSR